LATIEWNIDFIVTRWSDGAEKIFDWNQSETIGKPIMDFPIIYEEDIPIVQKTMERFSMSLRFFFTRTKRHKTIIILLRCVNHVT
jgi:PAS domain-containing protein